MPAEPPSREQRAASTQDSAIAVISAYGAFRVLIILLAIWTFFAGFSLLTHALSVLSFGGSKGGTSAGRVVGGHLLVLVPIYGLIAWRRDEYRMLLWVPYAAQLAVILPTLWDLFISRDRSFGDGALMLIVSLIFFVLLVYFWRSSHPLGHFQPAEEEDEYGEEAGEDEEGEVGHEP